MQARAASTAQHSPSTIRRAPSTKNPDLRRRIDELSVWKRGSQRAPHKPLLMRWALSRGQRGVDRPLERTYRVTLYACEGSLRMVGTVARLADLGQRYAWNGEPPAPAVTHWAREQTNERPLGDLDVHERDGLVFGVHLLHGDLPLESRRRLVEEVGWRADA